MAFVGASRRPEYIRETRDNLAAGGRHPGRSANHADAAAHAVYRRHRPYFCRQDISFLFYHHCLWRSVRLPFPDFFRDHAENAEQGRPGAHGGLRQHAGGIICRGDGDDRCLRTQARYLLCGKQPRRHCGKTPAASRGHYFRLGIPGNGAGYVGSGDESGRGHTLQSHGRRAVARGGHGAHLFRVPGRRGDGNLVSLRDHV